MSEDEQPQPFCHVPVFRDDKRLAFHTEVATGALNGETFRVLHPVGGALWVSIAGENYWLNIKETVKGIFEARAAQAILDAEGQAGEKA